MVAAGATRKSLHSKLFHVTCAAHLSHNCVVKIRSYSEDVDQLIAKVKSATVKKKLPQPKLLLLVAHLSLLLQDGKAG